MRRDRAFLEQWPMTVQAVACRDEPGFYYAKAGLTVVAPDGIKRPCFGFACSDDADRAAFVAQCECLEHLLGSRHYYEKDELDSPVEIIDMATGQAIRHVPRESLLIAGMDDRGRPRNATGLALGSGNYDPLPHAVNELMERHFVARWWVDSDVALQVHNVKEKNSEIDVVLSAEKPAGAIAVAAYVNGDGPLASFGSAFKSDLEEAVRHATAERAMMRQALSNGGNLTPRHRRLLHPEHVADVEARLRERMLKPGSSGANRTFAGPIHYAVLYEDADVKLVRAMAPDADDLSRDRDYRPNPFL